jgi:hypothetical protein
MAFGSFGLVISPPSEPEPDKCRASFWFETSCGEEALYLGRRRQAGSARNVGKRRILERTGERVSKSLRIA